MKIKRLGQNYDFWEKRYGGGGHSGAGRKGVQRWWKWKQISKYTNAQDVIDIGCGDLDFWKGRKVKKYIGIDLSPSLLEKNKKKRPTWKFKLGGGELTHNISAQDVFCLEMLYHIMDDKIYLRILKNLIKYSKKHIFVLNWTRNPIERLEKYDGWHYQKHRDFDKYLYLFEENGFKLITKKKCPKWVNKIGALWVFKKNDILSHPKGEGILNKYNGVKKCQTKIKKVQEVAHKVQETEGDKDKVELVEKELERKLEEGKGIVNGNSPQP